MNGKWRSFGDVNTDPHVVDDDVCLRDKVKVQ
jgi:hypothetical protein